MKRCLVLIGMAAAGMIPAAAQNGNSFETFRKEVRKGFDAFRQNVLDNYADYLDGVWKEYNAFRGVERSPLPKPGKAPVAPQVPSDTPPFVQQPVTSPEPQPDLLPPDEATPVRTSPSVPARPTEKKETFLFYDIPVEVPDIGLKELSRTLPAGDFAALWRIYADKKVAQRVLPSLRQYADAHRLNDWFIFNLTSSYANHIFSEDGPEARVSLTHYLLANWGYDVRIGREESGQPLLLAAIRQMVYARSYTEVAGRKYYLFYDSRYAGDETAPCSFLTYELPEETEQGAALDLLLREEPDIPFTPHLYAFRFGGLEIKGEVNARLMQMLHRYPQMAIGDYARSAVGKETHKTVVGQLRSQLAGKPRHEAANALLQFVQSAFEYATDDEQHGFEKPYFFEETLFYPKCDCEDRAIFYSYLLWHVLGIENLLIAYPGHEAVAIYLDTPIQGDCYLYDGKHFYVSDPTYIGAVTGMCMPTYRRQTPTVDYVRQAP